MRELTSSRRFPRSRRRRGSSVVLLLGVALTTACESAPVATGADDTQPAVVRTVEVPAHSTTATSDATVAPTSTSTPPSIADRPGSTTGTTSATTTTTTTSTTTTSSTTTVPPSTTVPGSLLALDVLVFIPVRNEHRGGYERDAFAYPNDPDGDGCDTRDEVLLRDSLTPPQVDAFGCQVVAGDWYSPYDGVTASDPGEVQVDHVVALKEAWDSGAWAWDDDRRGAFGNDLDDPRTLRAVTAGSNQAKSDRDPSNWLPPNPVAVCTYLADWIAVKARWSLSMDESEYGRIRNVLRDRCPDQTIAPWPPAPPPAAVPIVPAVPSPPEPPPATEPAATPPNRNCDPSYPTVCIPPSPPDLDCGDIPHRRFTVLPPDPHRFDGNDDGVGCEG